MDLLQISVGLYLRAKGIGPDEESILDAAVVGLVEGVWRTRAYIAFLRGLLVEAQQQAAGG